MHSAIRSAKNYTRIQSKLRILLLLQRMTSNFVNTRITGITMWYPTVSYRRCQVDALDNVHTLRVTPYLSDG
jgi:hypothetical protein